MSIKTTAWAVGGFILGAICSEYIGLGVERFNEWFGREFGSAPHIKIDFQTTLGCPSGNLADLKRKFSDQSLWLERGADRLFICSDNAINPTVDEAPKVLAREFPGCLNYITGSLRMLRVSDAVCALPGNLGYICDGAKSTEVQSTAALGSPSSVVQPCTSETMSRFGFSTSP
ncbi:hypothetical protein CO657_22630 (plasmid) [Rhizobium acidisoli]|uniref:Uncharacterized protein n=1 Tax=Rhizobium acidisoli TaxID=1538158 RepID=A0AAE5U022_9HYPH|nr:hypothetical protein [Rhizobium acidisoli]KPH04686.1 hypothetical protein AOG23_31780 [Rhizobium acidisoli]QAS80845.1 hypothetical protein CO657_22630 [Rhizobium acidisoli]